MKQQKHSREKITTKKSTATSLMDSRYFHIAANSFFALLLYFPSLTYQLTYYDDATLIENMMAVVNGHHSFFDILTQGVFGTAEKDSDFYYRPLLTLSFYLNAASSGDSLTGFHLLNILFHVVSACLLYFFLKQLTFDHRLSFLCALLLIAHPALVQSVAWIPGRNDSMVTMMSLASLIYLAEYLENRKLSSLVLHLSFFLLALLTKETAVLLPVLFVISMKLFRRYKTGVEETSGLKKPFDFQIMASWLVLIVVFLLIRKAVLGSSVGLPFTYTVENFIKNLPALLQYTGKMLLPFELSTFPILQNTSQLFGITTIILLVFFLFTSKNIRLEYLLLAAAWWLLFMLPAIVPTTDEYESVFLEHRLYFPLIGFLLLWLETDLVKKLKWSSISTYVIAGAILLTFSVFTFFNSNYYKDEFSYWSRAVTTSPDASFAHRGLGTSYFTAGNSAAAEKEYLAAIALNPNLQEVHNNLGRIYLNNGNNQKAAILFQEELKINPASAVTYYNLSQLALRRNDLPEAEKLIRKSLALAPAYLDAQNDLCVILAMQKKYEIATQLCIQLLEQHPGYESARQNIELIFKSWNDPEKVGYYKNILKQKGIVL